MAGRLITTGSDKFVTLNAVPLLSISDTDEIGDENAATVEGALQLEPDVGSAQADCNESDG